MPLQLVIVPCRQDNYAFLLHNDETKETLLVDVPEAGPIDNALRKRDWVVTDILLTHHHEDHVADLEEARGKARVIGAKADAHRLPPLDLKVEDGETLTICGIDAHVMDVSGHTVGHIALWMPEAETVFTADSLMALGCGRLFEGTAPMMWHSLCKLRDLPDDTIVCSGHEYTETNLRFAQSIDPDNPHLAARADEIAAARAKRQPTVPSHLGTEKLTNPFLRADQVELKVALGMAESPADEVFAEIRARKDRF